MTYPPVPLRIETVRLVLTPQTEADAVWFTELLNARGGALFTEADALEKIRSMAETLATTGIGSLVLRSRADGTPLGYCALVVGRGSLDEPEIAYEILPRHQGNGYATEASRALLDAASATGRTRIWSTVRAWNTASLRVLDKLGFQRDRSTTDDAGELVWLVRDQGRGTEERPVRSEAAQGRGSCAEK